MSPKVNILFSKLKLSHYGFILVAVPLIFEIAFVAILNAQIDKTEQKVRKEMHARDVATQLTGIMRSLIYAGAGTMTLPFLGGSRNYRFKHSSDVIPLQFKQLEMLTKDEPDQLKMVKDVQQKVMALLQRVADFKKILKTGAVEIVTVRDVTDKAKSALNEILDDIEHVIEEESNIEKRYTKGREEDTALLKTYITVGIALNILMAIALVLFFNRNTSRKLATLMDNSRRLANHQPLNPPLEGEDEIAQLDRIFNLMAASLDEASRKERAAVEHALDVICTISERGYVTNVSPASLSVLGYEPDELLRMTVRNIVETEEAEHIIQILSEIKNEKHQGEFECRVYKKDGKLSIHCGRCSGQRLRAHTFAFCTTSPHAKEQRICCEKQTPVSH